MAGYRKRGYSKKMYKKKGKKAPSNKSLNKKIKHIENDLIELKFADTEAAAAPIDNVAGIVIPLLDGIVVGDGNAQDRTGNQINVTSLQMRCDMYSSRANLAPTVFRCLVFWDKQPNAGLHPQILHVDGTTNFPSDDSVLDGTVISDPVRAPINYNSKNRFKIIYDHRYVLNPQVFYQFTNPVTGTNNTVVQYCGVDRKIDKYFKTQRRVKYSYANTAPAAAGSTEITTNALYVAFISDQPSGSNPALNFAGRVYFKDA